MRRTKEEADITRQRLLTAALTVFSQKGYADTRLEDIADEAGVTRGAIYHHFGGKVELYNTLLQRAYSRATEVMKDAVFGTPRALEGLKRLVVSTLVFAATDPEYRAISELTIFKTAILPELEEGIRQKIEGTRGFTAFIAGQIQVGIEAGEIDPTLNPFDAAISLIAFQNGLLSLWLLDPVAFDLAERADAMVSLLITGLTPK